MTDVYAQLHLGGDGGGEVITVECVVPMKSVECPPQSHFHFSLHRIHHSLDLIILGLKRGVALVLVLTSTCSHIHEEANQYRTKRRTIHS